MVQQSPAVVDGAVKALEGCSLSSRAAHAQAAGDGSPALPNTGQLVRVNPDGTFTVISEELNQPTSKEIIQNSAYIFTFGGEVWKIDNIGSAPFGTSH